MKEQGRVLENGSTKENTGLISGEKSKSGNVKNLNNRMQKNNRKEALLS